MDEGGKLQQLVWYGYYRLVFRVIFQGVLLDRVQNLT